MAQAYYGSKLSPNIMKTPEGFIICKNVPIARTGTQKYIGREIGINDNPDDIYTVYRTEEEVFSKKTIASFEGKCFTDEHPNDWVSPLNYSTYAKGTIVNVRRGSGNERDLLLGDIIVYNQAQIEEIEKKQKREISCGYECSYVPYKDGYMQKDIIGNHVALVSAGRAGSRVAIKDSKNKVESDKVTNNVNELKGGKKSMAGNYRIPRRSSVSDFFKAVGLKHVAMDAEPEDILDAVNEMVEEKAEESAKDTEFTKKANAMVQGDADEVNPEETVTDAELNEVKENLEEVKDALYYLLTRDEENQLEGEVQVDEDADEDMEALDDLEEELMEDDEVTEISSAEVSPEALDATAAEWVKGSLADDDEETCNTVADDAIELMRALKPIIAAIPDSRERKRVSDNLANTLKKQVRQAKQQQSAASSNVYGRLLNRAQDSRYDYDNVINIGDEIAKKYNPHYKEVK